MHVHVSSGQDFPESQGDCICRIGDISQWSYKLGHCATLAEINACKKS